MVDGCPPFFCFRRMQNPFEKEDGALDRRSKNKLHTASDIFIAAIIAVPGRA